MGNIEQCPVTVTRYATQPGQFVPQKKAGQNLQLNHVYVHQYHGSATP